MENSAGGNGPQIQLFDAMRLGGLDFDGEARELIGAPFFDNSRQPRGGGFFNFLEVETAGLRAKSKFLVDVGGVRGIVFLQVCEEHSAVAAVEGVQPSRELKGGGRVRELCLGGAEECGGEEYGEK